MNKRNSDDFEQAYNQRIMDLVDKALYTQEDPSPSAPQTQAAAVRSAQSASAPRRDAAPISLDSFDKAYDRHMRQVHEQLEHSRRLAQQVNAVSAQSERASAAPPPPKRTLADLHHDIIPDETILLEEASNMARRTVTNTSWQDNTERLVVSASLGVHSVLEDTAKDRIARENHSKDSLDDTQKLFPHFHFEKVPGFFGSVKENPSQDKNTVPEPPYVNPERLATSLSRNLKRVSLRMLMIAIPGFLLLYATIAAGLSLPLPGFWNQSINFLSAGIINLVLYSFVLIFDREALDVGFKRIFSLRFSGDSLIALSSASVWIYGLLCLCIPAWRKYPAPFILPILWLFLRLLFRRLTFSARYRSVRAVSRYTEAQTLRLSSDGGYDGLPTYLLANASSSNRFFYGLKTEKLGEQLVNIYALFATILILIFAILTAIFPPKGAVGGHFFQAFAYFASMAPSGALLLGCAPSYFVISKRMREAGAYPGGSRSFLDFAREGFTVVTDRELFPDDTVSITDFRPLAAYDRKAVYRYAALLLSAVGCSMQAPFVRAMKDDFKTSGKIANLRFTGEAISADLENHHIILGDEGAMRRAGFRINRLPGRTVVYMAIDAELVASFSMNYNAVADTEYSLRLLIRNLRIPVIASRDFNVTVDRVEKAFRVRPGVIVCPPIETRVALANPDRKAEASGVVFLKSGIRPMAETIEGARRFRFASSASLVCGIVAGALGLFFSILMIMNGWFVSSTPFNYLVFHILWTLPTITLAYWSKKY